MFWMSPIESREPLKQSCLSGCGQRNAAAEGGKEKTRQEGMKCGEIWPTFVGCEDGAREPWAGSGLASRSWDLAGAQFYNRKELNQQPERAWGWGDSPQTVPGKEHSPTDTSISACGTLPDF